MVEIQSKEVIDKISDELKVQPALQIPRTLGKEIQLNYNVNQDPIVNLLGFKTKSTTGSLFSDDLPEGKNIFLTGLTFNYSKDVTNDNVLMELQVVILGLTTTLLSITTPTLTAKDETIIMLFPAPIKIDAGSAIKVTGTFAAGTLVRSLGYQTYTRDPQ